MTDFSPEMGPSSGEPVPLAVEEIDRGALRGQSYNRLECRRADACELTDPFVVVTMLEGGGKEGKIEASGLFRYFKYERHGRRLHECVGAASYSDFRYPGVLSQQRKDQIVQTLAWMIFAMPEDQAQKT